MKKKILLIAALICGGLSSIAQHGTCGTDAYNQKLFDANPGLEEATHEHISRIASGEMETSGERAAPYYMPVVFHILHDGETGNISDEQCQSAIDQLNEDFNGTNSDIVNVRNTSTAPFAPYTADFELTFGLAKYDPDGNCTNGIERRDIGANSYNAGDEIKSYGGGGLDQWPRSEYLNIWVVNSIDSDGSAGTILGYAQFPTGWGGASTYGIVIRGDKVGTIGTGDGDRTLTHEIGHCLGLRHTFQGGCHSGSCSSNGDYCCDTPPQEEAFWSCSGTQNSCGVPSGDDYGFDALDQWENFMSYSPCQYMFSEDQKEIAHGYFESLSWMDNLTSLSNATDKAIFGAGPLCQAIYTTTAPVICVGSTVTFDDNSYHNVTGRTWTFEGGTPASSTAENPTITYSTPGVYDVTLEVTDGTATESSTGFNQIIVLADPGMSLPYSEGFETLATLPDNVSMLVENQDGGTTFQLYSGAFSSGAKSARLSNFGLSNGSVDALVSGPIDLSSVDPSEDVGFSFKYAYKRRSASNDEYLKIYISKDCGETWALRKQIHGDDLGPAISSSSYVPTSSNDWVQVDITNVTSTYYVSNFRYKIEFTNDGGNNMFIDDINIFNATTASIEEINTISDWSVYPNPVNMDLNLSIDAVVGAEYNIALYNVLGERIDNVYNGYLSGGVNTIAYNAANLPKGVYIVKIEVNGVIESKKIIKQ